MRTHVWTILFIIIGAALGTYSQSIAYWLDAHVIEGPLYGYLIGTIFTSLVFFGLAAWTTYRAGNGRGSLVYYSIIALVGGTIAIWSLFVAAMWAG